MTKKTDKPVIILVHGLRGDRHGLLDIARYLQKDFRVLVPDLPGSGDRPAFPDNAQNLDNFTAWLHGYIREQKLDQKPYIAGHSMGSEIASHFAARYPRDIQRKIVLISPLIRNARAQRSSIRSFTLMNFGLHLIPGKARDKFVRSNFISFCSSHLLTVDRKMQKEISQKHYRYSGRCASAGSLIADMRMTMHQQTIIPPRKDTLIILGVKDYFAPVQPVADAVNSANTQRGCKARLATVAGTGHLINYERPREVAQLMKEFYAE